MCSDCLWVCGCMCVLFCQTQLQREIVWCVSKCDEYFFNFPLHLYLSLSTLSVHLTVQTVLSEGGVPQRPVVFVSRPEMVNQIRDKLYRLQKEPGWITVFGMAGSGKSILAAESVRHHGLIEGEQSLTDTALTLTTVSTHITLKHSSLVGQIAIILDWFTFSSSWQITTGLNYLGRTTPMMHERALSEAVAKQSAFGITSCLSDLLSFSSSFLHLQSAFPEASTGCPSASWTNPTCW